MENPLLQKRTYIVPARAVIGPGALEDLVAHVSGFGFKKALVVTDPDLVRLGVVQKATARLDKAGLEWVLYDRVQPNPTCANVHEGLEQLQNNGCDWILSVGGGSPQDAAKAIGILATNGGDIRDYEGIGKSAKPSLPLVAVNTTTGTASEVTINYVITDEDRHIVSRPWGFKIPISNLFTGFILPHRFTCLQHRSLMHSTSNMTPATRSCGVSMVCPRRTTKRYCS